MLVFGLICKNTADFTPDLSIAELIRSQFGIQYHRDHVGRLMHSLNWSPQKLERRALERDENAIERWQQKAWPRIKKTLRGWVPT